MVTTNGDVVNRGTVTFGKWTRSSRSRPIRRGRRNCSRSGEPRDVGLDRRGSSARAGKTSRIRGCSGRGRTRCRCRSWPARGRGKTCTDRPRCRRCVRRSRSASRLGVSPADSRGRAPATTTRRASRASCARKRSVANSEARASGALPGIPLRLRHRTYRGPEPADLGLLDQDPSTPFRTMSLAPPASSATTGVPAASASTIVIPKSSSPTWMKPDASPKRRASSSRATQPRSSTLGGRVLSQAALERPDSHHRQAVRKISEGFGDELGVLVRERAGAPRESDRAPSGGSNRSRRPPRADESRSRRVRRRPGSGHGLPSNWPRTRVGAAKLRGRSRGVEAAPAGGRARRRRRQLPASVSGSHAYRIGVWQ